MSVTLLPGYLRYPDTPEAWDLLRKSVHADLDVDESVDLENEGIVYFGTGKATLPVLTKAAECARLEAQRETRKASEAVHQARILELLLEQLGPIMAADSSLDLAAALERHKAEGGR